MEADYHVQGSGDGGAETDCHPALHPVWGGSWVTLSSTFCEGGKGHHVHHPVRGSGHPVQRGEEGRSLCPGRRGRSRILGQGTGQQFFVQGSTVFGGGREGG